jgi:hypothetical protein
MFDLLAADPSGYAIPIQVKAINSGSWQFGANSFLEIEQVDSNVRKVKGRKVLLNPDLVCIFILLKGLGTDEFYIFQLHELQSHCERVYKPRGPGSKNPTSLHCAVSPKDLDRFRDNWELLKTTFEALKLSSKAKTARSPL